MGTSTLDGELLIPGDDHRRIVERQLALLVFHEQTRVIFTRIHVDHQLLGAVFVTHEGDQDALEQTTVATESHHVACTYVDTAPCTNVKRTIVPTRVKMPRPPFSGHRSAPAGDLVEGIFLAISAQDNVRCTQDPLTVQRDHQQ